MTPGASPLTSKSLSLAWSFRTRAGLVMPASVGSLMGTLPLEHTGVGSATNGSFLNLGGALGVAILGSIMTTRYQHQLDTSSVSHALPAALHQTVLGSLGAALTVAGHAGGVLGVALAAAARAAFMSGMGAALATGAAVVSAGVLIALLVLPSRQSSIREPDGRVAAGEPALLARTLTGERARGRSLDGG